MTPLTSRHRRSLSKALSLAANASVGEVLQMSQRGTSTCRRIGITGPPGAGKSTLIGALVPERLVAGGDIAVLAIDPTSPVSGGAILGDRVRMEELAHDPRVYIRSLASRRSRDGLADNLPDILEILENAGFAELILETVGVGQVEHEVRHVVDTNVLVITPGAGDQIQAMKGGILETADILAVNKSDQPGSSQLVAELRAVLKMSRTGTQFWTPPIITTTAANAASIRALSAEIDRHQAWLDRAMGREAVLRGRKAHHVSSLVARRVSEIIDELRPDALGASVGVLYRTVVTRLAGAETEQTRSDHTFTEKWMSK
jgi:LAO/AO transport system kinase